MNASVNVERNSWRLPPDETVQVADPRSKSAQVKEVNRSSGSPCGPPPNRRILAIEIRFGCMYVYHRRALVQHRLSICELLRKARGSGLTIRTVRCCSEMCWHRCAPRNQD